MFQTAGRGVCRFYFSASGKSRWILQTDITAQQSCLPEGSEGESGFPASIGCSHSLACGPFLHLQSPPPSSAAAITHLSGCSHPPLLLTALWWHWAPKQHLLNSRSLGGLFQATTKRERGRSRACLAASQCQDCGQMKIQVRFPL